MPAGPSAEQVPGLLERYQRRTVRLREQVRAVVFELAGRASARLLPAVGITAGRDTALRTLLGIPLPEREVPEVLGIDDFALRRSHTYATVLIDADTGARIDVIPGRGAQTVTEWLGEHPGVRTVCRDGSTAYAQAVRDALPDAVQVADRWHLWHGRGRGRGQGGRRPLDVLGIGDRPAGRAAGRHHRRTLDSGP